MTQERKDSLLALRAAEDAEMEARAKLADMERAAKEQQKAVADAVAAKNAAQEAADSHLPPVLIVYRSRWSGTTKVRGVILKRTDKTISAKPVGAKDSQAEQFRRHKHRPDVWVEYPAPKGYGAPSRELEFTTA